MKKTLIFSLLLAGLLWTAGPAQARMYIVVDFGVRPSQCISEDLYVNVTVPAQYYQSPCSTNYYDSSYYRTYPYRYNYGGYYVIRAGYPGGYSYRPYYYYNRPYHHYRPNYYHRPHHHRPGHHRPNHHRPHNRPINIH